MSLKVAMKCVLIALIELCTCILYMYFVQLLKNLLNDILYIKSHIEVLLIQRT